MKNSLLTLIIILIGSIAFAVNPVTVNKNKSAQDSLLKITAINVFDTVVFDLSQEIDSATSVEFPVYFLSDDTINALDFSLKFDLSKFAYDTIINQTNYLTVIAHLAPDSVLRLTSYSLQKLTDDTPLVSIRFTKITGQPLCSQDIDSIYSYPVHGYLNGDPCTVKIINCVTSGIVENNGTRKQVKIFPNPANEVLNVNATENAEAQLFDIDGREALLKINLKANQNHEMNIANITNGIYLLKIFNANFISTEKVVINK